MKCTAKPPCLRIYRREEEALRRRVEYVVDLITLTVSGLGILSAVAFLLTM